MVFYILFQLAAIRAVIIDGAKTVIDLAGGENKSIFFTMRNDRLEFVVILPGFGSMQPTACSPQPAVRSLKPKADSSQLTARRLPFAANCHALHSIF
jgi:hypothetical protein